MDFTTEQVRLIRQGRMRATLLLPSTSVRAGTTRGFYKRIFVHDENGDYVRDPKTRVRQEQRVRLQDERSGELIPAVLTVLSVADGDVTADVVYVNQGMPAEFESLPP